MRRHSRYDCFVGGEGFLYAVLKNIYFGKKEKKKKKKKKKKQKRGQQLTSLWLNILDMVGLHSCCRMSDSVGSGRAPAAKFKK